MRHPVFARFYAWMSPSMDAQGALAYRRRLLAGLTGRVLEVGAGNGLNFAHYPREVAEVVAVEPEPYLRQRALEAAGRAAVPVHVVDALGEALPLDDGRVDAAVTSLALCSVGDPLAVLREIHRVLRDGGELRFFEHVRAESPGLWRVQRAVDVTFWPRVFGGCHSGRDTLASIESVGFRIDRLDRFRFPEGPLSLPTSEHVLGVARRLARG